MQENKTVIGVQELCKSFGQHVVLDHLSFDLSAGENLVVMGKSGAGKSVLTKCIVRLIEPDHGDVTVLGQDIMKMDDQELNNLRKRIGYLFQAGALYDSMNVRENLAFPLIRTNIKMDEEELDKLIIEALENVDLVEAVDKMPVELSGGMKKRIGLARTLILKPDIIFYDEPTTGLDPFTSHEISELIVRIQKKYRTASVILTHDKNVAKVTGNRIFILHNGKFIAEGSFSELGKSNDPLVKSFFV